MSKPPSAAARVSPASTERPPLPAAFVQQMQHWLGAEWPQLHDALDGDACRGLRWQRPLGEDSASAPLHLPTPVQRALCEPIPWWPAAYYIDADAPLGKLVYHEMGAYYIQEPSAMAVVAALDAQPGERILDLCAAPGGKSTAIGQCLRGTGTLVANEIHPTRVLALAQNLERMGVPAVITNEPPARLAECWPETFDAIVVDAPCSGEGMFRKDWQARFAWQADAPDTCAARQQDILQSAFALLRPGGRLVYSTCTFNPLENEQVVAWLRTAYPFELLPLPMWTGWDAARPEFSDGGIDLAHARRLWPHRGRGEGHFVALLRKSDRGSWSDGAAKIRQTTRLARHGKGAKTARLQGAPARDFIDWLCELTQGALRGDGGATCNEPELCQTWLHPLRVQASLLSDAAGDLSLDGLRVLRPGICLATSKNGRFEPHHQLAMAVTGVTGQPLSAISLPISPDLACDYFRGEGWPDAAAGTTAVGKATSRYVWVNVDGLPAGWAKRVPGRINNLYPKGLRRSDLQTT